MMLRYPNLRRTREGILYDSRRGPVSLYGGKMVENVIQALARIIVFNQMAKMDQWLRPFDNRPGDWRFKVVHTVHDEIVCVVPQSWSKDTEAKMEEVMTQAPSWADGLPIACEVKSGYSYGDAK
jgi:DNA polymerase